MIFLEGTPLCSGSFQSLGHAIDAVVTHVGERAFVEVGG